MPDTTGPICVEVKHEIDIGERKLEEGSQNPAPGMDPFQVFLQEHERPQNMPTWRKWFVVIVICTAALCVASASSMASFTEDGVAKEFGVGREIAILSISLFIEGLGLGPLVLGPLSEVYGRNIVYRVSYTLTFAFTFPVAFAPNIAVYLIFRFIGGVCGSAFLSVVGGSVSDLFDDKSVANAMAFYTMFPFIGPVLGPLLSGFINQDLDWRWTYYVLLIWTFVELILIMLFVPETYVPLLVKNKAISWRTQVLGTLGTTGVEHAAQDSGFVLSAIPSALVLGILYLSFQAFPFIFERVHNFNTQSTGMSFLGIGVGMLLGFCTQPIWNRLYRRTAEQNMGKVPPEVRLVMGEVGAVCVPVGLFWVAFTTYKGVHWIVPIIASIPFGAGIYFVFTSTFTYLVTAYRPIAASAMASNSAMRSTFAAVFPLFSRALYLRLGTVGATALLAGLTAVLAPLPFIFRRIGASRRQKSRFAQH